MKNFGPRQHFGGIRRLTGPHVDDLDVYLAALAGRVPESAFLEIRYRVSAQGLAAEFVPAHDRRTLAAAIRGRGARSDVYVGCAPRVRQSGTKQDIAGLWVLWAECDGFEAARAARSYDPAPSIVVASGSGPNVHAYWPLRSPLAPRDAEVANLRLAYALGADRVCYDAARILRPPGTWNHKHRPPHPVKALRMERGLAFDASEVILHAPPIQIERIERRWTDGSERDLRGDPLLRIPPAVYVSELLGVPARPGRKVHCPFHDEQHPSLHVYPTPARGWSCFSCGRGGSIYDLAAGVWRMRTRGREFVELRQLLHERFANRLPELDRGLER